MAKRKSRNPIGFTPWPVTFWSIASLIALFASLVTVHNIVPPAPSNPIPYPGVNLTEAWRDLQFLTNGYHPYNSRRNDQVRDWLLQRIEAILKRNAPSKSHFPMAANKSSDAPAVIINDIYSNLTFSSADSALSVAFTGTNIIVYIRGTEDAPGLFWTESGYATRSKADSKGGVLVNAHFDSVPSGFGATDDGVGVITILQLISYFTVPQNQPKRGIVALLNNGEEDYLNGAYAFSQHPISTFPHTFLNLEGAGAGGRAVLFRSTDTQVTKFYKRAPHPFGTVVSADGFKRGLVRSQTDYVVFNGDLGMRGLDVAFFEPRSRYHTREDSAKYTSKNSLWHMLSASIATMQGLTSDMSSEFDGEPSSQGKVASGEGSESVWFDVFGERFAVFDLHSLFAVSVTLLVATPILFLSLTLLLVHLDKWYPFSNTKIVPEVEEVVRLDGLHAFFRTPVVYVVSIGSVVGLAFLLKKINPYIISGSPYSVWSMMLSGFFIIFWFLIRGADSMRPSALQRMYTLMWMYIGGWLVLVGVTVGENNFHLAGGYFMVFYFGAISLALLISYLELFALPSKTSYAELIAGYDSSPHHSNSTRPNTAGNDLDGDEEANERTSLLRGDRQRTFGTGYGSRAHSQQASREDDEGYDVFQTLPRPYGSEQAWSGKLPSWTWILQFLILGPVPIILVGQVALFTTSSLYQTASDGSSVITVYLFLAILSMLLLAPITPFIHRISYVVPTILFWVFAGTLLYNLLAFPFSDTARLKVYFSQSVNLDTGVNVVSLTGLPGYVQKIIDEIPSAANHDIECTSPDYTARAGLTKCQWQGIPPNVLEKKTPTPPEYDYAKWINFTATRDANTSSARFHVSGKNTRACRLLFNSSIETINVQGYATDPRFPSVGKKGCKSVRLWSREWGGAWDVDVSWKGPAGLSGQVVCLWSDANEPDTIPAYTEVMRFMPRWSIPTKLSDGLVEGTKAFNV